MTPKEAFLGAYTRVCKGRNRTIDREHAAEVWRVVGGYSSDLFDAVATRLNSSAEFFPSAPEWVKACEAIDGERTMERVRAQVAAADHHRDERTYHCPSCRDSGLETGLKCTAMDWCGPCRRRGHRLYPGRDYIHTYAAPCACRDGNPVWQASLAERQRAVQSGRQMGRHKDAA
jgi:hypothetical protein